MSAILDEAEHFAADVILLGWRGHGAIRRVPMSSVARGVVRGATCAVLVVRRSLRVKGIVVGFDGSATAERALALARTVLANGEPLRELLATIARVRPQLLVVGARGASGVRHLLLGSVAEGALNRSPVPVLVAR